MITLLRGRCRRGAVALAVAVAVLCLAPSAARADEMQYLPADTQMIVSLDMSAFLKSKSYQQLKKLSPQVQKEMEQGMPEHVGIPVGNIQRLSAGVSFTTLAGDRPQPTNVGMIRTAKAVTADGIKGAMKSRPYEKNVTFKEIKVGKFTVYQKNFQIQFDGNDQPGKMEEGETFCVVEENLVLYGRLESVKKILDRKEQPKLSANLKAGLQIAGLSSPVMLVWDVEGMPDKFRQEAVKDIGRVFPGVNDIAGKVRFLAAKASEGAQVNGSAALVCKDAASAADVKKAIDATLSLLKGKLPADDKAPKELQDMVKGARSFFDALKLTVTGERVNASATVEPAAMVGIVAALLMPVGPAPQPQLKEEFKQGGR